MAVPTKQTVSIAYGRLESQVSGLFFKDKGIIDNAFGANPTIKWLRDAAMRKPLGGGERIYFPVRLTKRGGEAWTTSASPDRTTRRWARCKPRSTAGPSPSRGATRT